MENNNNNQPIFENETNNQTTNQQVFYCRYCGNELNPNYRVCLHCGAPNQFYGNHEGNYQVNNTSYQATPLTQNEENRKHFNPQIIIGLILSMYFPFASVILGIISLVFTLQQKDKRDSYWKSNLIMSIVLIVIGIILSIYFIEASKDIVNDELNQIKIFSK